MTYEEINSSNESGERKLYPLTQEILDRGEELFLRNLKEMQLQRHAQEKMEEAEQNKEE